MPARPARLNAYGEALPRLTEAPPALADRPVNQAAIASLAQLLDDLWPEVLRRGWYGQITLAFCVEDGTLQHACEVIQLRKHHL